jgi:UDP-N-acetylglucosamine--N-acetylmuramyl-(pentapeptide) pyrophosphoryl-undecaprenol N-acetylglucosamine transferase
MLQAKPNNIVLTGGHAATTAVAFTEEIKSQSKNWKIYWIGVKNAIEGKKMATLESEVLPRLGVKFLPITTGRLQRKFTIWTIPSLMKIPCGFAQSVYFLLKIKPKVILSFGGFASFPVVMAAKLLRIPVVLHEQTSVAGRANLLSAKFASKITLSREQSLKYFPNEKCVITGNPVMKDIKKVKPKLKLGNPPIIFITGGSRGSQIINSTFEEILKPVLAKYKVIHQTGGLDYLKFSDIKQKLPQALRDNYDVFVRVNPLEVSEIFSKCDVIVSRAGANTVSEIMTIKRPAILIPLSISYMQEQMENAKIAREWGIAKIISQDKLTPLKLLSEIEDSINHFADIIEKIKSKESPDVNASKKILSLISTYMK